MTAATTTVRRFRAIREIRSGIVAVSVKELRGRMRGRRAFVMLTIHLLIVAGFAFMVEEIAVRSASSGFGGSMTATSDIGRGLFTAILLLLTLVTLILGPASTAGAISLEREKQTLDLLTTTPISSLAIVLGKLLSGLSWIVLLMLASIPIMSLVFMFGGVGPESLLRGYVVLFATALLYGSMGLFVSALFKRTQAATVINLVLAIALTAGTGFLYAFGASVAMSDAQQSANLANRQINLSDVHLPPAALLWLNPFSAQIDVLCGTDTSFGTTCQAVLVMTDRVDVVVGQSTGVSSDQGFGVAADSYWPRSVAAMLGLSVVLILASSQLISPTRRWKRPRLGRRRVPTAGGDLS